MAFLFKSKKQQSNNAVPPPNRDIHTSEGPKSSIPTVNGFKDQERAGGPVQTTPSSSVNNSLNSLGGADTPSPEHGSGSREKPEQDSQIYRNATTAPASTNNATTSLYPWSQRRLTFTTSTPSPFPRYGAAVNSVSSKEGDVYLMGGLVDGSTVKGDLWMVEAGGGSLACYPVPTHSEGPGPRVGHASLLAGNAFIVFGGDTKSDDRDVLDDTLYLLNTSTRQWSRALPPGSRPAGRYGHTLNILGSRIYVFGGQVEGYFFNDLLAFDLNALQTSGSQWEMLIKSADNGGPPPGQVPPARTNHTVVSYNDKLYLFGGTNGVQWFNDVWTYDPRFNAWSQLDCIGYIPAPREGHSAALVNDVMYIFGGRTEEGTDLGDLAAFRITSRRWYTFQNMGPAPSPRSGHSMTAYGKQIVVLAGEPSSAPRDPSELSLVYLLDTVKIRYPNDQQIQQTPAGERVPGIRRPSGGEKSGIPQSRALLARDGSNGPPEGPRRTASGQRESTMAGPMPFGRGQDPVMANGPAPSGPGSRLPRASIAQAPPGPPPQQQAPPPRTNGTLPAPGAPRSKTPTRPERGFGPPLDTIRATSFEENNSPVTRDGVRESSSLREHSPIISGRRTPTQQSSRLGGRTSDPEQPSVANGTMNGMPSRSRSRQDRQQPSLGSIEEPTSIDHDVHARDIGSDQRGGRPGEVTAPIGRGLGIGDPLRSPVFEQRDESLIEELAAARSRNAWYASELALARKAGYQQSSTQSPVLDERAAQSFGDDDRPLIEALLAMKAELANVQGSVDSQATLASKRIAEVEQQKDAALMEAAYAKAKLAAHGGSQTSSPQPDGSPHELRDVDRTAEFSKRLASALALQHTLQIRIDALKAELLVEKRARELAEGTADAAQRRIAELEESRNTLDVESLRARFSETEKVARDEAARRAEAESSTKLLQLDKDDLARKLEDALSNVETHTSTLGSLRGAVVASSDKSDLLEQQLDEERIHRQGIERKLLQLKAEHEERTAELENTSRRLRDAEELGEKHAAEAKTHRQAVLSGLEKAGNRSPDDHSAGLADERVDILRQQVASTNTLLRENKAAADAASENLRKAEERIAGLEAYQEQASREGLQIRKQLQSAMRETQSLQVENSDFKQQLETHQRDANALAIQHGALKDLLGERGISVAAEARRSRNLDSPGSRFGTPDQVRLRDLEQQLESSLRTHQEIKASFETREQEADKTYREKLEQLENDYQSAVHYVKGTEKMLKRMKDELAKHKTQNARMQTELEDAQKQNSERSLDQAGQSEWEDERNSLKREIGEMQEHIKTSVSQLEGQMQEVRDELRVAQDERDQYRTNSDQAQRHLANLTQQARADLEQLKNENNLLESRALDAEQKVSLLLDQVESSYVNYRRQSQHVQPNGVAGHHRTNSATSAVGHHARGDSLSQESTYGPENRNSVALDSLATELETLRSHWETTNRNYRLSSQFDFERTPTSAHGDLSDSLANWRRRLDLEESEPDEAKDATPEVANQRVRRAISPINKGHGEDQNEVGSDRLNVI